MIGTVYTCSIFVLSSNVFNGSSYTHSVMRSCTSAAKTFTTSSSITCPFAAINLYRRLRSKRLTLVKPHDWQIATAFVLHALWYANRGPTSTTGPLASATNADCAPNNSGSYVSRNNHVNVSRDAASNPPAHSALKHCSVSTRASAARPNLAFTLATSVAAASALKNGRRK